MKAIVLFISLSLFCSSLSAQTPELFMDIKPNGHSSPDNLAACNDKLFFTADDGINGNELWVSDGTPEGTHMLVDFFPGSGGIVISQPTCFKNDLYFTLNAGTTGFEFWKSDGTPEGTQMVKDFGAFNLNANNELLAHLTEFNDKLFFAARASTNEYFSGPYELWCSDGTLEGTYKIINVPLAQEFNPTDLTEYNGNLYFAANDLSKGRELWVTDSTQNGTYLVKDINPGGNGSNPRQFCVHNDKLYFNASDGIHEEELWVTDGTEEGTYMVKDINPVGASNPGYIASFEGKLYFQASDNLHGAELWVSDGSEEGTILFKGINPEFGNEEDVVGSNPQHLFVFNGRLYFTAHTTAEGSELWVSDGTEAGTVIVKDLDPGVNMYGPKNIVIYNDRMFFTMMNVSYQTFLATSDGTEEGTHWLKPAEYDEGYYIATDAPVIFNGSLYFSARYQESVGKELYRYTGLPANITENENSESILIYPNPSDGHFTVFTENFKDGEMEVYSITGEKILTKNIERETFTQVNLSYLSSGVYIIRLHNAEKVQVQRFIIR